MYGRLVKHVNKRTVMNVAMATSSSAAHPHRRRASFIALRMRDACACVTWQVPVTRRPISEHFSSHYVQIIVADCHHSVHAACTTRR